MPNPKYAAYQASKPYFELVRGALGDLVDGEHFFDIVTGDVVYEVLYDFPGWPRIIRGRADLMAKFRAYGDHIKLQSADRLITHKGAMTKSCGRLSATQAAFLIPSTNTTPSITSCSFSLLFNRRQPFSAFWASLNAMANPAARDPGPLVR